MHPLCESVGPAPAAAPMNEPVADRERRGERHAAFGPLSCDRDTLRHPCPRQRAAQGPARICCSAR